MYNLYSCRHLESRRVLRFNDLMQHPYDREWEGYFSRNSIVSNAEDDDDDDDDDDNSGGNDGVY